MTTQEMTATSCLNEILVLLERRKYENTWVYSVRTHLNISTVREEILQLIFTSKHLVLHIADEIQRNHFEDAAMDLKHLGKVFCECLHPQAARWTCQLATRLRINPQFVRWFCQQFGLWMDRTLRCINGKQMGDFKLMDGEHLVKAVQAAESKWALMATPTGILPLQIGLFQTRYIYAEGQGTIAHWEVSGLPAGISWHATDRTCMLTGSPLVSGSYRVKVSFLDLNDGETTVTFPLVVQPLAVAEQLTTGQLKRDSGIVWNKRHDTYQPPNSLIAAGTILPDSTTHVISGHTLPEAELKVWMGVTCDFVMVTASHQGNWTCAVPVNSVGKPIIYARLMGQLGWTNTLRLSS